MPKKTKKVIKKKINYYYNHPNIAADYYFNKISSSWAEPTFQLTRYYLTKSIDPNKDKTLQNIRLNIIEGLDLPSNAYHILLLLMAFLGLVNMRKKLTWQKCLPMLAVVGYFLFSILWEAKSRYVFLVFPLFVPYASSGAFIIYNKVKYNLYKLHIKGVRTIFHTFLKPISSSIRQRVLL